MTSVTSEVAIVQNITLRNRRTVDRLASIWPWSESRHVVGEILLQHSIRPQEISIRQDVAAAEEIDVINSAVDGSCVVRVIDDGLQVRNDMVAEDNVQVVNSTGQSRGGEAIGVGGVGESLELAWLVFGVEDDLAGLLVEVERVGDAESGVQEGVDSDDVGVPLDNGGLDVGGGRVIDSVQLALVILACAKRDGCCEGGECERCCDGLHRFRFVLRVIRWVFESML